MTHWAIGNQIETCNLSGIELQWMVMRMCRVCHQVNVLHRTGPATCLVCRQGKYRLVRQRYRSTPKGQTTTKTYEQLEYVKERRRQASRSQQGRRNKAKYEATKRGRLTRQKAIAKYRTSQKAKISSALRHQLTKHNPQRRNQRRRALDRYRRTEKGKAWKRRGYAKRKGAILSSVNPLTASEWAGILQQHNHRCHYCHQETKLTIDHVIPLSKGGAHVKENVVPACTPCNSKKSNHLLPTTT